MTKRLAKTKGINSSKLESFIPPGQSFLTKRSKLIKAIELSEELKTKIDELNSNGLSFNAERRFARYEMYKPGDTFEYRLKRWLRNFEPEDRDLALDLIKSIRYISRNELRVLSEFVLDFATTVTWEYTIRYYKKKYEPRGKSYYEAFNEEMKQNIFVAVSDDTGFDHFRRLGRDRFPQLEKDNFIEYYKMDKEDIQDAVKEVGGHIKRVFLLDQMCGSGTTAFRLEKGAPRPKSKGKLRTFFKRWKDVIAGADIYYTPLIASSFVESILYNGLKMLEGSSDEVGYTNIKFRPFLIVPPSEWLVETVNNELSIREPAARLLEKYYELFEEDEHTIKGDGCLFGLGGMGLALVIGTNCPNNTLYIIWHGYKDWYPLFPRVAHHRHETIFTCDLKKQKRKIADNCQKQVSKSALSDISIVELKRHTLNFDFVASVSSAHPSYRELRDFIGPNWIAIETSFSEGKIIKAIEKIREVNEKDNMVIELYTTGGSSVESGDLNNSLPPTTTIKIDGEPELIVPFLSASGPIFSQHSSRYNSTFLPAIMFPLSGRTSLDELLRVHSKYIDSCQIRTEKFLYAPAESPAITFYRVAEVIENWSRTKGIEYEKICLVPACDSTSMLAVTALAGIYNARVCIPKISNEAPYTKSNNLILMKHRSEMEK